MSKNLLLNSLVAKGRGAGRGKKQAYKLYNLVKEILFLKKDGTDGILASNWEKYLPCKSFNKDHETTRENSRTERGGLGSYISPAAWWEQVPEDEFDRCVPQVHLISGIFFSLHTEAKGMLNVRSQSGERRHPKRSRGSLRCAELRSQGPVKHL